MGQTQQEMKMLAIHSFNAEKLQGMISVIWFFIDLRETFVSKEVNSYTNSFNISLFESIKRSGLLYIIKFPFAPMGVLAPMSAHARLSA